MANAKITREMPMPLGIQSALRRITRRGDEILPISEAVTLAFEVTRKYMWHVWQEGLMTDPHFKHKHKDLNEFFMSVWRTPAKNNSGKPVAMRLEEILATLKERRDIDWDPFLRKCQITKTELPDELQRKIDSKLLPADCHHYAMLTGAIVASLTHQKVVVAEKVNCGELTRNNKQHSTCFIEEDGRWRCFDSTIINQKWLSRIPNPSDIPIEDFIPAEQQKYNGGNTSRVITLAAIHLETRVGRKSKPDPNSYRIAV